MSPVLYVPCKQGCCRTPWGVCGRNRLCDCHQVQISAWLGIPTEEAPNRLDHSDPTGNKAVANVMRERRRKK